MSPKVDPRNRQLYLHQLADYVSLHSDGRELPPEVGQHLLRHSSIVMTLDVYGHLFRDGGDRAELAEASRALLA
jgi:integrase